MKIIKLFCSGGMSTSFLASKMQTEADNQNLNYIISAHGISTLEKEGVDADLILLAPQISYMKSTINKDLVPKVLVINGIDYGRINAKSILFQVEQRL